MLSPFREFVVGFNRGVKGREAGTVPERAAAHPHSASRRGGGVRLSLLTWSSYSYC